MAVVTELITELGFDVSKEGLAKIDAVETRIEKLTDSLEKIGHTLTGGLGIKDYFIGALGRSQDIINTSRAIGMSTDALQEWQYAAKASGVSSEAVISDLENLRANFFMSEKSVLRLADSFKKMSAGTAYWYGNMYGLSKDTVLMLRQGSEAIKERQKVARETGAITPEEELEKAAKLNAEIEESKIRLQKMVDTIVLKVVPGVTKLFKSFEAWLAKDPGRVQLVIQGITAALIGLTAANIINGIKTLIATIVPLLGMIGPWGKMAIVIGSVVVALKELYEKCSTNWQDVPLANFVTGFVDGLKDAYKWVDELIKKLIDLGFKTKTPDTGKPTHLSDLTDEEKNKIIKGESSYDEIRAKKFWEGYNKDKDNIATVARTMLENQEKKSVILNPAQTATESISSETSIRKDIATAKAIKEALQIRPGATTTNNTSTTQDFNGATINIITGASPQDFVDFLQQQGASATSFNGLGFIN